MFTKIISATKKRPFYLILVVFVLVVLALLSYRFFFGQEVSIKQAESDTESAPTDSNIVSNYHHEPTLSISSEKGSGSLIAQTLSMEPAIDVRGYGFEPNQKVEIATYTISEGQLLQFLLHDNKNNRLNRNPDISGLNEIYANSAVLDKDKSSRFVLPLEGPGLWLVKAKAQEKTASVIISRSGTGVIVKNTREEFIFWGQDLQTKRSIADGSIKLYNLENEIKSIAETNFASDGIAKTTFSENIDLAIASRSGDLSIIPINLRYLDADFVDSWMSQKNKNNYFVFTDRPIYRPGDTVNFKAIIRSDDDANYSINTEPVLIRIFRGYTAEENKIFEKIYQVSENGSVAGDFKLDDNTKPDDYYLTITRANQTLSDENYSSTYFAVNLYRKPEYSLEMSSAKQELIAGEKTDVSITGTYFFGEKMAEQEIKYQISRLNFSDYDYLNDRLKYMDLNREIDHYWYGTPIENRSGRVRTNSEGVAIFEFEARNIIENGRDQIVSIEAEVNDGSGNPAFARKNILVHAGEFNIYRREGKSSGQINQDYNLPLALQGNFNGVKIDNIEVTAKIERTNWVRVQPQDKKQSQFKEEKEKIPSLRGKSDSDGNITLNFKPTKVGSYNFTIETKDARGNFVSKNFYVYITDKEIYYTSNNSAINVTPDKELYQPGEKAKVVIASSEGNRDLFFALERANLRSFQVIRMEGNTATLEFDLNDSDIPNIFAEAQSFASDQLDFGQEKIAVSAESKKLTVDIQSKDGAYGPGEEASLKIVTKDFQGNPKQAEVALWAVDKSIFQLSTSNLGEIFDNYWSERWNAAQDSNSLAGIYEGGGKGGCFTAGTKVTMANGKEKLIEEVKVGDQVLSRDPQSGNIQSETVLSLHQAQVQGYLVVNNKLKVTQNHILNVDNDWLRADKIKVGDQLVDKSGKNIRVDSVYWQKDAIKVYNLEIKNTHTYFANNYWVHNGKGDGDSRTVFKDTAYWNPNIQTNENGEATVSFKLPDNLTTWTIAAVGATNETIVGQTNKDIVVKKDFIVRPVLPNLLRVGDSMNLRALAHNFTDKAQDAFANLTADGLEINEPQAKTITLKPNLKNVFSWKVKADKQAELNIVTELIGQDNTKLDSTTQNIPVRPFEFTEQKAFAGTENQNYEIPIAKDALNDKTIVSLNLSASSTGTLSAAMKYLVRYPYGCAEQVASALLPAVTVRANPKLFSGALDGVNIDEIVSKSLRDLNWYQQNSLWSWWKDQKPNYYVSAYIVDVLTQAQKAGYEPDAKMMAGVKSATANEYSNLDTEQRILNNYMQAILGSEVKTKITDYDKLSPDLLAINVMANYLSGDKNAETNGLMKLISLAKSQGDAIYWDAGADKNFGSVDASTALSVRAILLAGGDTNLARRAVTYLVRNRKTDYWSNTFASSQVIMALTENAKVNKELDPNYKYTVKLNGEIIREGEINGLDQSYSFDLPADKLKNGTQKLSVSKTGDGELYSVVVAKLNRTDRGAGSVGNTLSINRTYELENGHANIGDTIKINFKVKGLTTEELYGVIKDELPAGLVPIDETLDNEYFVSDDREPDEILRKEKTENGMILSLWKIKAGTNDYSYRARVVASGSFIAPPANIALMYAPEISARTEVQTVKINENGSLTYTGQNFADIIRSNSLTLTILFVLLLIGLALYFYIKKRQI